MLATDLAAWYLPSQGLRSSLFRQISPSISRFGFFEGCRRHRDPMTSRLLRSLRGRPRGPMWSPEPQHDLPGRHASVRLPVVFLHCCIRGRAAVHDGSG